MDGSDGFGWPGCPGGDHFGSIGDAATPLAGVWAGGDGAWGKIIQLTLSASVSSRATTRAIEEKSFLRYVTRGILAQSFSCRQHEPKATPEISGAGVGLFSSPHQRPMLSTIPRLHRGEGSGFGVVHLWKLGQGFFDQLRRILVVLQPAREVLVVGTEVEVSMAAQCYEDGLALT